MDEYALYFVLASWIVLCLAAMAVDIRPKILQKKLYQQKSKTEKLNKSRKHWRTEALKARRKWKKSVGARNATTRAAARGKDK